MEQKIIQAFFQSIIGQNDIAIQQLTEIQAQDSNNNTYEISIAKAVSLLKLNNYDSAIKECEKANELDSSKLESIYFKAQALFYKNEFQQALDLFQVVNEKSQSQILSRNVLAWISKCQAELNNQNMEQLIEQGGIQAPQKVSEANKQQEQPKQQQIQEESKQVTSSEQKIKYTWYQTASKVTVEILFALNSQNDLQVDLSEQQLVVSFPINKDSNYDLTLDLFDRVIPGTKSVKVLLQKIEITFEKENKGNGWKKLIGDGVQLPQEKQPAGQQRNLPIQVEEQKPFYPSSSRNKKNWDKIDKEIEEDISKNKAEYGEDDPNGIFKQIYQHSDEDTRRAMIKSYQTSGGTVLSTNWKEVQEKDYEGKDRPSPPKGQKWGKWEK